MGSSNYIDFGPPQAAGTSSLADLVPVKVRNGYFWSAVVEAIRLGPKSSGQEFVLDPLQAIFSTSSLVSLVPEFVAEDFFARLLTNVEHSVV